MRYGFRYSETSCRHRIARERHGGYACNPYQAR
nr:MAG TPA: hypothetical protein [Caudoviricetes sp.]